MANAQIYAPRLVGENKNVKIQTLKSRLGIIPGTGTGKPEDISADDEQ
jgi:hypothetical protein